jgi:pimeloyl-ACP methyl ester carboxylesterase
MNRFTLSIAAIIASVALLFSNCFNLDPFLFSGKKESGYLFDNYTGERECGDYLSKAGPFPASLMRQFTVRSGGETIAGVYLMHAEADSVLGPTDTLLLYFHGKADNIDFYWPRTRLLYDVGYPTMVIDYRGFGMSSGTTSEQGLYEDARAAMRYIRETLGNPRVIIYGFSLGSIPSCEIASTDTGRQVMMLLLEAPIGSVATIVENGTQLAIPGSFLTTYDGNNAEKIRKVKVPFLWLHGTRDETLNRETHGLPVWNNYPDPDRRGRYIKVEGGGHADLPQTMSADYREYIRYVRSFIHDSTDLPLFLAKQEATE